MFILPFVLSALRPHTWKKLNEGSEPSITKLPEVPSQLVQVAVPDSELGAVHVIQRHSNVVVVVVLVVDVLLVVVVVVGALVVVVVVLVVDVLVVVVLLVVVVVGALVVVVVVLVVDVVLVLVVVVVVVVVVVGQSLRSIQRLELDIKVTPDGKGFCIVIAHN